MTTMLTQTGESSCVVKQKTFFSCHFGFITFLLKKGDSTVTIISSNFSSNTAKFENSSVIGCSRYPLLSKCTVNSNVAPYNNYCPDPVVNPINTFPLTYVIVAACLGGSAMVICLITAGCSIFRKSKENQSQYSPLNLQQEPEGLDLVDEENSIN